jgi:hypothetical protein
MTSSLDLSLAIHTACEKTSYSVLDVYFNESPQGPFVTVEMVSENPADPEILYANLSETLLQLHRDEDYVGIFRELTSQ